MTALSGSYTLERELGGGGMSRVFVATEDRLGRRVVVKVLSPELAAGVSAGRFEREIRFAASLQQANIVPLLATGELSGIPFYTMPFVEGESLRARLARSAPLPIGECVDILRDVTRALGYAHAHGVVHRDIKPDNVLLSHGTAVVADFGIAKAISAARTSAGNPTLTDAGSSLGTPSYMSPEQVAGDEQVDHRADLYALGCMAYELLTGRPPFVAPSPQRVLGAHISETPRPVAELRPETPAPLAAIVMKCLAKDPAGRPADAAELSRALEESTGPNASHRRPSRWTRLPVAGRVALLGVVALGVAIVGVAVGRGRSRAAAPAERSVAVLPLRNLSGDKANDYFGEGLAEEITDVLSKAGVRVIGRSSAAALAARGVDPGDIAKQLGVGALLQGSVQRAGDDVRVTVQLTSAGDGATIWSETYDKQLKDVFAVQDQIARSVASALRVTLAGGAQASLARVETVGSGSARTLSAGALSLEPADLEDAAAGRRAVRAGRRTGSQLRARLRRRGDRVRALSGLRQRRGRRVLREGAGRGPEGAVAGQHARRTLHRARVHRHVPGAQRRCGPGVPPRDPGGLGVRDGASLVLALSHARRPPRGGETPGDAGSRAGARVPRDQHRRSPRSSCSRDASPRRIPSTGMSSRSIRRSRSPCIRTFSCSWRRGKWDSAIATSERLLASPVIRHVESMGWLAFAQAHAGRPADARRTLARLAAEGSSAGFASGSLAAAYDALGEHDRAIALLRSAFEQHDPWLMIAGRSPAYDRLRKDPAGAALFARAEAP